MTREDVENAANVFYEASKLRSTTWETELIAFAVQQVNAALEEAADEVAKRVIGGRAWNENQALEGRVVAACAATVRARKIP